MATPYKMKGSPMARNFGIGASPVKQEKLTKITDGDGKLIRKPVERKTDKKPKKNDAGEIIDAVTGKKKTNIKLPSEIKGRLPKTTRKDTLKGITQFEHDATPVTNVLNKIGEGAKKGGKLLKKAYIDDPIKIGKNIKKYFTEK